MTIEQQAESLFKKFWQGLVDLVTPKARALSIDQIFDRAWSKSEERYPMAYLQNLYADDDGSLFALLSQDGRLYRTPVSVVDNGVDMGEWVEVKMEFPQVQQTRTQIIRQLDGRVRWFSVSATSVLNRDREIDSRDLFDSFIAYAEKTGNYPYRTFYHLGEQFRTGQADFLARDGNCYVTSGLYDNSEIAENEIRAIEKEPNYWGESIGYLPTSPPRFIDINGIKIPVYRAGINIEISNLPEKEAAGLFTVTQTEVNRMLTGKQWDAFVKKFDGDEEKARQWLEQNVDATNRAIGEGGLITRSQPEEGQQGEAAEESTEGQQVEIDDNVLSEVVRQVTESESFTGFGQQLNDIVGAIEALNGATDKLRTQLEGLQQGTEQRLATLERSKTAERQEWTNDLPAKNVIRVGMKQPRFAPTNEAIVTSTDKANSTLSKLPA